MEDVSRGSDNMGRGPVLLTNVVCTQMDIYFSIIKAKTMIEGVIEDSRLTLRFSHTCP